MFCKQEMFYKLSYILLVEKISAPTNLASSQKSACEKYLKLAILGDFFEEKGLSLIEILRVHYCGSQVFTNV